jgi:hypothetical protein
MERQRLVEWVAPSDLVCVVGEICGLHAQLMSSAELSLWARIDGLESDAVQEVLWKHRALVKLWAMRRTLYLLPSAELGLWLSALGTHTKYGNTGHPATDMLADAVGRALEGRVLTREELVLEVGQITGSKLFAERVCFSWGVIPEGGLLPRTDLLRPERGRPREVHHSDDMGPQRNRQARLGGRTS